jgi:rhodanese-related sulfurtransferase
MSIQFRMITPRALYGQLGAGESPALVDVRIPGEFASAHVPGARLFPLDRFDPDRVISALGGNGLGRSQPVYLTCQSGARAVWAADRMRARGYENVVVVAGGTEAWVQAGLPVARRSRFLSLERQVQIAVGALVLLKVAFGFAIHPLFFVLLAGLGLGLIVAGLTENRALAKLLARMPWNREGAGHVQATA